jgi:hypothetical protein
MKVEFLSPFRDSSYGLTLGWLESAPASDVGSAEYLGKLIVSVI